MARKLEITASIKDEGRRWTLTITSTNADARNLMLWKLKEVAAELNAVIRNGNDPFATATAPQAEPESEREPTLLMTVAK